MGVRMNVQWDDGTRRLAAGDLCTDFSPHMEARLVRSGLAELVPPGTEDAPSWLKPGFAAHPHEQPPEAAPAASPAAASMAMTRNELLNMAEARAIEFESDDNKSELVRKINEAG